MFFHEMVRWTIATCKLLNSLLPVLFLSMSSVLMQIHGHVCFLITHLLGWSPFPLFFLCERKGRLQTGHLSTTRQTPDHVIKINPPFHSYYDDFRTTESLTCISLFGEEKAGIIRTYTNTWGTYKASKGPRWWLTDSKPPDVRWQCKLLHHRAAMYTSPLSKNSGFQVKLFLSCWIVYNDFGWNFKKWAYNQGYCLGMSLCSNKHTVQMSVCKWIVFRLA